MQSPDATFHPVNLKSPSSRYVGFAFAAAINIGVIWAILNGLTIHPGAVVPPDFHVRLITQSEAAKPHTLPPVKITLTKPVIHDPTVQQPIIQIETPPSSQPTIASTAQPVQTVPDSAASGLMETHTTPPYPAEARNLSRQGTVTLMLSIDATGAVTNAQVKASSGYPDLDQTAVNWVIAHWRYKPAIQNGTAVASTALAAVKFDLKNGH